MSKDETSQEHHSLLSVPLEQLTRGVVMAPGVVLGVGVGIAAICIGLAIWQLEFRASRLDLLNPASGFNQRWLAYLDEFGEDDDIAVVIRGESPANVVDAVEAVTDELNQRPQFRSVMGKVDLSALRAKGLYYLSAEELTKIEQLVARSRSVLDGDWKQLSLSHLLNSNMSGDELMQPTDNLDAVLSQLLGGNDTEVGESAIGLGLKKLEQQLSLQRLLLNEGRTGIVLTKVRSLAGTANIDRAIGELRRVARMVESRHLNIKIGLTGMPILESDEMAASQRDTTKASVLSLLGVSAVFAAGFGGLRRPLLAVAALVVGIAWSMGYITLAVGHLNILSVAFGAILIGLGIDFGIHYLARYLQGRNDGETTDLALLTTASSVGPGIVTGGVTTTLAFLAAGLTDFTGVAELGIVAGGGVVCCVIAALIILPALLKLTDRRADAVPRSVQFPFGPWCRQTLKCPKTTLLVFLALTLVLAGGLPKLTYDHNLLNLQPKKLESVELERMLAATSDRSVWYAVSVCDSRTELLVRQAKLQTLSSVAATEEIASLLPESNSRRQAIVEWIARQLASLPEQPPLIPVVDRGTLLNRLSQADGGIMAAAPSVARAHIQAIHDLTPTDYYTNVSAWQQRQSRDLLDGLRRIRSMASLEPPLVGDLPESLASRYIGRTGKHLLKIYGDKDIWNMDSLERFVRDVESVDPRATGHPIQTYYASSQMRRSYLHAAIYSLLAVAIVLMLDFQSIKSSLLAMLPMGLGVLQLLGLLGWLGVPLNPANMIVLPLILGIGIDDGVHVIHDALRQRGRYLISDSTASAIILTSATTMIGFGSMMIASHQGLRSLGQVLTIGVFCCLVSSVVILPLLLGNRHLSRD